MILLRTRSVGETRSLAAALAGVVEGGELILLEGDLGAGKTAFVQGFGEALGVSEPITSPTFTLARQYQGRLRLNHLDVYRFDAVAEVRDVGLAELLDDPGAVTLIEWGGAILPALPRDLLEVRLTLGEGDDDRDIELRAVGQRWSSRHAALEELSSPWVVPDEGRGAGC